MKLIKKSLSLFLVFVMVLGILPLGIFAIDANQTDKSDDYGFISPTGDQIKSILGDDALVIYHPFGGTKWGDNCYLANNLAKFYVRNGTSEMRDGEAAVGTTSKANFGFGLYTSGDEAIAKTEFSGRSFVVSIDYKQAELVTTGSMLTIRTKYGASSYVNKDFVYVDEQGNLTVDNVKIGTLTADKYTNIAFAVDVKNNVVDIFIDGVEKISDHVFLTATEIANIKAAGYTDGFAASHMFIYRGGIDGFTYYIDNATFYWGDYNVAADCPVDMGSGEFFNSNYTENAFSDAYKSDAKYWVNQPLNSFSAAKDEVVNSGSYWRDTFIEGVSQQAETVDHHKINWEKGYAGLDFAFTMEIQAHANTNACTMQIRALANGIWGRTFAQIVKGANGPELWLSTDTSSLSRKLADLPSEASGKFLKVTYVFDAGVFTASAGELTKMYVFIDDELVAVDVLGNASEVNGSISYQKGWIAALGDGATVPSMGASYGGVSLKEGSGGTFNVRNARVYYYDGDADGDVTNGERGYAVKPPTKFIDFDNKAIGTKITASDKWNGSDNVKGNTNAINVMVAGTTGSALSYTDEYFQVYGLGSNMVGTKNKGANGKPFMFSADIKMSSDYNKSSSSYLFSMTANDININGTYNDVNILTVMVDKDGYLYTGEGADGYAIYNEYDGKIHSKNIVGKISKEYFTNVGVFVDPQANTYQIYINGYPVTSKLPFLKAAAKKVLTDGGFAETDFAISYTRFISGLVLDNVTYNLTSSFDYAVNAPFTGYAPEEDKVIKYVNGMRDIGADFGDNAVTTDSIGAVTVCQNRVKDINKVFSYAFSTDSISCETVIKNGLAHSFIYTKGDNSYYYDNAGNRVTRTAFDIKDDDPDTEYDVLGYFADASGVITPLNGKYTVKAGIRYYSSGLRHSGLIAIGEGADKKYYYADESTGLFKSGIVKLETHELYLFDEETYEGTLLDISDDAVAVNKDTCAEITDLAAALSTEADETVDIILVNDYVSDKDIAVSGTGNFKIDLNGKVLEANSFATFGNATVIDSGAEKGLIKVKEGFVYNKTTSDTVIARNGARDGYEFYTVKDQVSTDKNLNTGYLKLYLRPSLDNSSAANAAIFTSNGHGVQIQIYLKAYKSGEVVKEMSGYFSDEILKTVYTSTGKALYLNLLCNEKYDKITVDYKLSTDTGMICELGGVEYDMMKKISFLGDSITTYNNVSIGGRPFYGDGRGGVTDVSQTWWSMLMADKGYKLEINQSRGGSTVCNIGYNGSDMSTESFIYRMDNIGNPDIIVIHAGTNDNGAKSPVGEYKYSDWTADDLKTFRPAYAYMLNYLKTNHKNARIVVLIPKNNLTSSIIEICKHYNVEYVELSNDIERYDGVHPTNVGMVQLYNEIKDYFN